MALNRSLRMSKFLFSLKGTSFLTITRNKKEFKLVSEHNHAPYVLYLSFAGLYLYNFKNSTYASIFFSCVLYFQQQHKNQKIFHTENKDAYGMQVYMNLRLVKSFPPHLLHCWNKVELGWVVWFSFSFSALILACSSLTFFSRLSILYLRVQITTVLLILVRLNVIFTLLISLCTRDQLSWDQLTQEQFLWEQLLLDKLFGSSTEQVINSQEINSINLHDARTKIIVRKMRSNGDCQYFIA